MNKFPSVTILYIIVLIIIIIIIIIITQFNSRLFRCKLNSTEANYEVSTSI
jgi:hypothetical protein